MPIFDVQAPNGKIYSVEAPEGTAEDQIFAFVNQQMGAEPKPKEGVGAAFMGGVKRYGSDLETALESIINPKLAAERGVERTQKIGEQYAPGASLDKVIQAYKERGIFPAAGEAISQIPSALAEQFPNTAAALGGARLGAMAGSAIAPGVGTVIGGVAGAGLASLPQLYAQNIQRQAEEKAPEISRAGALGAAVPGAALEVASQFIPLGRGLLGKILGPQAEEFLKKGASEAVEKAAKESILGSVTRGGITGLATEIPTEVAQQMLERLQAGLSLTTDDALKEYGEAAYGAGLVGGPFGAGARTLGRSGAQAEYRQQVEREQQEELAAEQQLQAEQEAQKALEPETYEFPGGYTATAEEVGRSKVPEGYQIYAEGSETPLTQVEKEEDVQPKLERLNNIRKAEAEKALEQIDKISEDINKARTTVETLEATGQTQTEQYMQAQETLRVKEEQGTTQTQELMDKVQTLSAPLTSVAMPLKTKIQNEYVLTKGDEVIGRFPTPGQAEAMVAEQVGPEEYQKQYAAQQGRETLKAQLAPMLKKFNLQDVGLDIVDQLEKGAGGKYVNKLISVAMDEPDPVRVMKHESIHALKDLGFFTPQQIKVLNDRASKEWVNKYLGSQQTEIDGKRMSRLEGYRQMGLSEDEIIEEAIADAFGDFDAGAKPPPGMIASLFKRIKSFFEALRNSFRGAGFQTADDIFKQIESGKLKPTQKLAEEAEPKASLKTVQDVIDDGVKRLTESAQKHRLRSLQERYDVGLARADSSLTKIEEGILRRLEGMGVSKERDANGNREIDNIFYNKIMPAVGANLKKEEKLSLPKTVNRQAPSEKKVGKASLRSDRNSGKFKPNEKTISTRKPTSAKPVENLYTDKLNVGIGVVKDDPKILAKHAELVRNDPLMGDFKSDSDEATIDHFIEALKSNLLSLWNATPKAIRDRSANWYNGANKIANNLAQGAGVSEQAASGVLAALSPQTPWDVNVSQAARVITVWKNHQNTVADSAMIDWFDSKIKEIDKKAKPEEKGKSNVMIGIRDAIKGKSFKDVEGTGLQPWWLRAYDETHHSREFHLVAPEGKSAGLMTKKDGSPANMPWGNTGNIEKALSILRNDSMENISDQMGDAHKVRSFYNNIVYPDSPDEHVTIDTHAVAAARFEPLSGNAPEVAQAWGGQGSSSMHGQNGLYGEYAEAYRRAAKELGVLPREVQSVTWEKVRGLFPDTFKTEKAVNNVKSIWKQYQSGEITIDEAREQITASSPNKDPNWSGVPTESAKDAGASIYEVEPPSGAVRRDGAAEGTDGAKLSLKNMAFHSGDLGYAKDTVLGRMMGRSTGHFGTGTYFTSEAPKSTRFDPRADRPKNFVSLEGYKLAKPYTSSGAEMLHKGLEKVNLLRSKLTDVDEVTKENLKNIDKIADDAAFNIWIGILPDAEQSEIKQLALKAAMEAANEFPSVAGSNVYVETAATRVMRALGYEGIDVRHLPAFDNTQYGSVVYGKEFKERVPKTGGEKLSLRQVKEIFDRAEKISEPPGVESIREQWIGGVSGIGDRNAMYDLYRVDGSKKYIQDVQDFIRKELGDAFKGYRLMSNEELEEIQTGSMGSQFASFTLNPDVARAFKNIPANAKKTGMSVVEMDLTPEHVAMIGHPGELELVVDYGQGYNPDEVKVVEKYSQQTGDVRYSLKTSFPTAAAAVEATKDITAPDTREFKLFQGASTLKEDGKPKLMFHGSKNIFFTFRDNDPIFVAEDADSAEYFARDKGMRTKASAVPNQIYPLWVRAETPFDFENPVHVDSVVQLVGDDKILDKMREGDWRTIEGAPVQKALKQLGFDSFYVNELRDDTGQVKKNLAVFKANQVKSATGNFGDFSEKRDIRYSLPNISASANAAVGRVTTTRETKGWAERLVGALGQENYSSYRQQALNRYNRLGEADKLRAEKMGGAALLASNSAESAALMSDLHSGVVASVMGVGDRRGGIPILRNGITTVDHSQKGVTAIFAPLAQYQDPKVYQYFQFYSAVKRGARLLQEGRERVITPQDVKHAQELGQKFPEFEGIRKEWVSFNNALVKYQVDTGVLSKKDADVYTMYSDYIPFYRQMDGERTLGPNIFQSISGVKKPKALKGGEAPLADFLETVVRNTHAAIGAGMKNVAAQRAVSVGKDVGIVQDIQPGHAVSALEQIVVLENGVKTVYQANDQLFIDAVKSLNMPELPFMSILSAPANLLRNLVTKDPGFIMTNLLRDSLSAYVTSGTNATPIAGTVINFAKSMKGNNPSFEALMDAGIIGGYEFSANVEQSGATLAKDLARKSGKGGGILTPFTSLWEGLEKASTASDAATRMAVYDRVLQETGNEAEALYRALEVMNFNRKGSSAVVRILTAAVPFLNARMQGLDIFYRASFGRMNTADAKEIQRKFFVRGMTMMGLSALYYFAVAGSPDYEKQEQETKDNNWLIPGVGIKIPIPFEVGTLFKTVPERILAYYFGTDTGEDFKKAMWRAANGFIPMSPAAYIPQTLKPLLEVMTNYSFFTQREIVNSGLKDVDPEFQVGPGTSAMSQFVGKTLGLSPMKVDHMLKGYTGTMGMYAIDMMDSVMDQFGDSPKPSKRFEQMPVIKRFALDPEARGSVTNYYELKDSVDTAVRTMNLLERSAKPKEFAEYLQKNVGVLAVKDYVADLEKSMKDLRDMKRTIQGSPMKSDEKRDAITAIGQAESNLTQNIQTVKRAISELK
jgi:hypothetical protein